MNIILKHISDESMISELRNSWEELELESNNQSISSSFIWFYNWWVVFKNVENNKLGYNKELFIVQGFYNNKLILICPLMKLDRIKYGIKITFVEFIGQQWGGLFHDIICNKDYSFNFDIIKFYINKNLKYDILHLRYISKKTLFNDKDLNVFGNFPEFTILNYKSYLDYINLNYSKGHKQNLRTAKNRAIRNNDILEFTKDNFNDSNFNKLIKISNSKIKSKKESIYNDINKLKFYNYIFREFNTNIIFVKINQVEVAYRVNLIYNKIKFCIDASYERGSLSYELGSHSLDKSIEDSFNSCLIYHSEGPGLDPYKLKFIKSSRYLFYYLKRGNSLFSFFYLIFIKKVFKYN
jgi:hypothetical protein